MIKYTIIATDDDEHYKLSALLDKDKYVMPKLECNIDGKFAWCLDNDKYLIGTLLPALKLKTLPREIKKDIPKEDFEEVLEILEEGIKIGFFESTKL